MTNPRKPVESLPASEEQLRAVTTGGLKAVDSSIAIMDYEPAWPVLFEREATRIRAAVGDRLLHLEHVGSTSVPGLAAKPKIDILLVVADSADESDYVPDLEAGL